VFNLPNNDTIFTTRRYAKRGVCYANSVCLSVTRVYCIKAAECIIELLSLSDRFIILVFRYQGLLLKSDGFVPNGGAEYKGVAIFDHYGITDHYRHIYYGRRI